MQKKEANKEQIIKDMQAAMLMFKNQTDKLNNDFLQMQNEMQALHKETGKVKTLLEEGGSSNGFSSGGDGTIIDEKDLELKIKKILFEDEDLGKTFEKIITNSIDFEERKKEVDEVAVNKKLKTMKKTKKISKKTILISAIIGFVLLIGGYSLYRMSTASSYIVKKGQKFYSFGDNGVGVAEQDTNVKLINKDGNKIYFTSGGKKYYLITK